MSKLSVALVLTLLGSYAFGQALLIEETKRFGKKIERGLGGETRHIVPISQRSSYHDDLEEEVSYEFAADLREKKRMGVGIQGAGTMGLLGVMLELNLNSENSALVGFGGGPGYNSANFQWKRLFNYQFFAPYVGLGYSRWYSNSDSKGSINKASPSVLTSQFLSEEEKNNGVFAVNLLTPVLGIQYHMLSGPQVGAAYFAEVVLLTELEKPQPTATAGLGAVYYF